MIDFKSILASRTVWAGIIGIIAMIPGLGEFAGAVDVDQATLHVSNLVGFVSFLGTIIFRVKATKQIATGTTLNG